MFGFIFQQEFRRLLKTMKNMPWVFIFYLLIFIGIVSNMVPIMLELHHTTRTLKELQPYISAIIVLISFYKIYFAKYPILKIDIATYQMFYGTKGFNDAIKYNVFKQHLFSVLSGVALSGLISGFKINYEFILICIAYISYGFLGNLISWIFYNRKNTNIRQFNLMWIICTFSVLIMHITMAGIIPILFMTGYAIWFERNKLLIDHQKYYYTVIKMTKSINAAYQIDFVSMKEVVEDERKITFKVNEKSFSRKNVISEKIVIQLMRKHKKALVIIYLLPVLFVLTSSIIRIIFNETNFEWLTSFSFFVSTILYFSLIGVLKLPIIDIFDKQKGGLLYPYSNWKIFISTLIAPGGIISVLFLILTYILFFQNVLNPFLFITIGLAYYTVTQFANIFLRKYEVINILIGLSYIYGISIIGTIF